MVTTLAASPRQPSAKDTATLRDQHDNPPERGNPPQPTTWAFSTRTSHDHRTVACANRQTYSRASFALLTWQ